MHVTRLIGLLTALTLISIASSANAAPIQMSPNPASVNAVLGHDFNLILDSGDSETNTLNFTVEGSGGCGGFCPSTAFAAIVFDGASVLDASDTDSSWFSSGNVVRGLITPDGSVAGLLVDFGAASSESFTLTLDATPTTATLYALNLDNLDEITSHADIRGNVTDSTRLQFTTDTTRPSSPIPEPSAAIVFAAGLLISQAGLRRR